MRTFLRWFAVIWAGGVYLFLLVVPMYSQVSNTVTADGSSTMISGRATLVSVNGSRVYLVLAVPLLAALLTLLPWPDTLRKVADVAGAVVATAFVVLGMMSVGLLFVPTAGALISVALRSAAFSDGSHDAQIR
jgi:hypothetical protein